MAMAVMMSKTRDLLEDLVRDSSWALTRRTSFRGDDDDEFGDLSRSPSGQRTVSIPALSPIANLVLARCSQILDVAVEDLQRSFDAEASEAIRRPSHYARNLVEYCCFRTLALSTQVAGHLSDKSFRRLTFDMMLAWDSPSAASPPPSPEAKVGRERTVGVEAFSRIAPAIPSIADVVSCSNLFNVLTASTGGRLSFAIYDKYLSSLDRAIKKMKTQSESSLLSDLRFHRGERIIDIDGNLTTQPVLEHVGMSAWPGRLVLTDHALYFEALKVVAYDKPKIYDLADDLNQCIKPELTGPWGSRVFDKAVMYKSISLSEPVFMEFPELTGHSRRDYWFAIMREVLYAHMFIRKFQIEGVEKEETLLKAVLGILRLQALLELVPSQLIRHEALLVFNLCDDLPGGDRILEILASTISSKRLDPTNQSTSRSSMYSTSALGILSNLGVVSQVSTDEGLVVREIIVGEMTSLERAVTESMIKFKKVEQAQATIDVVKVDGLDANLALMKELLHPITELGNFLLTLASWDDPVKSSVFCCTSCYIILRGWLGYVLAMVLLFVAMFIILTRFINQGRPTNQLKVLAPPPMNTVEQLLAVQNAISQVEELVRDGNIVLLKLRALLLAVPSQATYKAVLALVLVALAVAFLPGKLIVFMMFLDIFTQHSPPRRASTERWTRRLREWWFSIPAAPVVLERDKEEKKM